MGKGSAGIKKTFWSKQMKKEINFEFDGNKYKVDVESDGENLVITKDGKTYNVKLIGGAAKKPAPRKAPAAAPVAAPVAAPAPVAAAGAKDVVAPMPGTIKDVKVKVGDAVKNGQLVCIMEAMKMDMEVFASADGTVAEVCLAGGSSVQKGQAIVKLA